MLADIEEGRQVLDEQVFEDAALVDGPAGGVLLGALVGGPVKIGNLAAVGVAVLEISLLAEEKVQVAGLVDV